MTGKNFTVVDSIEDLRTFSEKAFFNFTNGQKTPKKMIVVDCEEGDPEDFPEECIILMQNYKSAIVRGRKDPLKGKDVLAFNTEKGIYMFPLDEAQMFAAMLYTIAGTYQKQTQSEE